MENELLILNGKINGLTLAFAALARLLPDEEQLAALLEREAKIFPMKAASAEEVASATATAEMLETLREMLSR